MSRIEDLRVAYRQTHQILPFQTDAVVVLPDHLHAMWTLPEGDADISERWRQIKCRFTRRVGLKLPRSASKRRKREAGIWQRRFWEHRIRDSNDFRRHLAYCWNNPVHHGLVEDAMDWPFSSIHRDRARGLVAGEWDVARELEFGEP